MKRADLKVCGWAIGHGGKGLCGEKAMTIHEYEVENLPFHNLIPAKRGLCQW